MQLFSWDAGFGGYTVCGGARVFWEGANTVTFSFLDLDLGTPARAPQAGTVDEGPGVKVSKSLRPAGRRRWEGQTAWRWSGRRTAAACW